MLGQERGFQSCWRRTKMESTAQGHQKATVIVAVLLAGLAVGSCERAHTAASSAGRDALFEARVEGIVTSESGDPIEGAEIRADPMRVHTRSGPDGRFELTFGLESKCELATFTVTRPGFGAWRSEDNPIYANMSHTLEVTLGNSPLTDRVGPPLEDESCRKRPT